MKPFLASWGLAVALLVPTVLVLITAELLHGVPAAPSPRLVMVRRVLLGVGIVLLVLVAAAILARFLELRT